MSFERWTWHPFVLAAILTASWLYFRGAWRLARRGERSAVRISSLAAYAAGSVALVTALVSPVDFWSSIRFSVHMTQHEILMVVAAPLLVVARPLATMLWAFDSPTRLAIGEWVRRPAIARTWRRVTGPLAVFVLQAAALWIWHLPSLYQAALASDAVHAIQHACFLGTACLFWWALVHGRYGRLGYGLAVGYVFATSLHANVLGALLTFSPWVWYPVYALRATGTDALVDQQLAGLIMWIPFGAIFVVVGLALFAAWLGEAEHRVTLLEEKTTPRSGKPADVKRETMTLAALLLVALAGVSCERARRTLHVKAPFAVRPQSIALSPLQAGPKSPPLPLKNPYEDNAYAMTEGQRLYDWYNCSGCHFRGGGGIGPPFMAKTWRYGDDPGNIYTSILEGRPNGMPSWRGKIPDYQIWQLVTYVETLKGGKPIASPPGPRQEHLQAGEGSESR